MAEPLNLDQLLKADRVVIGLESTSFKTAVSALLDRLDAAQLLDDREAIEELIEADIDSGDLPTLGDRALLAHYRTDAARGLAVAIGTAASPFPFAPEIAPEARILVLIVAPRSAARYYLKVVGSLSRVFRDSEVIEAIANASAPEELLAVAGLHGISILPELTVQDLMSRRVNAVPPETPLSEVLRVMVRYGRRAVPVVSDSGEVLGLITEQDVLQHFLPRLTSAASDGEGSPGLSDREVRDVMQRSVLCLSEDQLISDVAGIMKNKNLTRFPVVREGVLVGFLSTTDIIRKLLDTII